MAACSKDEVAGIEPEPDSDFYTVKIGWEGEIIDVTYEPLDTRATTDDLYGIQVYSTPNDDATTPTWTPYAYGLFDDPDNISINLLKGYKYKFVATMVRDGKNKLSSFNNSYHMPFRNYDNERVTLNNSFDYQSSIFFDRLEYGSSTLLRYDNSFSHPNTDRFYGELVNYTPGDKNATAKINMKRTAFGAKFIAKGAKAKEGTLHVQMTNAPAMELALTTNENKISDIFTFSNVAAAWADNKYTETIDVTINWERPDGTTLPLGTHAITYKRNATTVVNVKIENDGADGGLGFEIDESETGEPIADGENDVTIEDGEVVDTDVDTNGSGGSNEESESANIPNNQIWYTATAKVETKADADFGATIKSNEFAEGRGVITFEGDISKVGDYAFFRTTNSETMTSITLPKSVLTIGEGAFYDCDGLVDVDMGSGVQTIKSSAFCNCNALENITIPASVTVMDNNAFESCTTLAIVHCKPTNVPNNTSNGSWMIFYNNAADLKIYVPAESVNLYRNATGWKTIADKIVADE